MIGAKGIMISLEAALPEDEETPSILAEFIEDIAHNLMISARIILSPLTLSVKPYLEAKTQLVKGTGIILNAANKILTLTAQMVVQVPKNLLEVGTTLVVNVAKLIDRVRQFFVTKSNHVVPLANEALTFKHRLLNIGSHIGFSFREFFLRGPERSYIRAIKSLEPETHHHKQDYSQIIASLNTGSSANTTLSAHNSNSSSQLAPTVIAAHQEAYRKKPRTKFGLSCSSEARTNMQPRTESRSRFANVTTIQTR
jgi:hypothetical protein